MHDDPSRQSGQPEHPGGRPHGNMRLLVAGLIAVIVGLVVAIAVIAGNDGDSATSVPAITTLPSTGATTGTGTTTDTTSGGTPTPTTSTTTGTTPPTSTDEDGSGGLEVP